MIGGASFQVIQKKIETDYSRKVDYIQVSLVADDVGQRVDPDNYEAPAIYFTDIMFQGGSVATSWVGHVSEIRWSFDTA